LPHVSASYNGINIPILWRAQITNGYRTASWMTYRQALELGAQVRGGEKSTHVVFTKQLNVKDKETDEEKKIGMLKAYSVFNVAQIDGVPAPATGLVEKTPDQRRDHVDAFIAATKADIRIGGDRACYVPSLDFICLPPESAFKSREHFLATSLHECGHWTGAKSRLDRDLRSRFNEKACAALQTFFARFPAKCKKVSDLLRPLWGPFFFSRAVGTGAADQERAAKPPGRKR
jgi:antirestriction protein ArdC